MQRIPVLSVEGSPLMPTTAARARIWVASGKAVGKWNDLGIYYVQLTQPAGDKVQPIVIGIDPGKKFSGIAAQSPKFTLFLAHLVLPFEKVRERMEQRAMMRRGRRGRRINRKISFAIRAHREKRFDNRRNNKLPPSIRANRQLELRVVTELYKVFPVSSIVFEYVKANGSKSFSPVMVGQKWMVEQLSQIAPTFTQEGWKTAQIRTQLGLVKTKNKAEQSPQSHAVDGIALAASQFMGYEKYHKLGEDGAEWIGSVDVTPAIFKVIRRPPISRRQLHLMVPAKGGVRRKYGGTTGASCFRKADLVRSPKWIGFVSGEKADGAPSISDSSWKRLGYVSAKKVELIRRSTGLVVHGY
jgi:RRXRR protein